MKRLLTTFSLVFLAVLSNAQTGSVTGVLKGSNDSARAGVRIVLTGTSFSAVTAPDGSFTVDSIPFGSYTLEQAEGANDYAPVPILVADAVENVGTLQF